MISNEFMNEILINEPLLDSHTPAHSWGVGNHIVVAPSNITAECQSTMLGPVFLHEVSWSKDMHHGVTRKLLNESSQVFVEVQSAKHELSSTAKAVLLKFSRKYRSILRSCVLDLKTRVDENIIDDPDTIQQMKILKMMETIWNLCEILFIENCPAGVILSRLLDWCKWHFTDSEDMVEECLQSEFPYTHELYWDAVKGLVYQGRTEDASNMLKLHPSTREGQDNAFTSMVELLRKMPRYSFHQGQTVVEFDMKWNYWQDECRRRLTEGEFEIDEHLLEMGMILCGKEDFFDNPSNGSWYQMLVARLLYTQPTVGIAELPHHSKLANELFRGRDNFGAFDSILLAAFELDPYLLLKECSRQLSNWWLSAHLADLFHHSGLLSQKKLDFGVDFREHLLLEYAASLMSHDSLWKVAVNYFSACSESGHNYLSLFVQRVPLTSEKRVAKLLRICQNHGLTSESMSICRQMSVSALQHNRVGTALVWCLRSNDSSLAIHIAKRMLEEYAKTGNFNYVDLLDHLGTSIMLSEQLTFLGKYRDFHKLLGQGQLKEAGNVLFHLLISKLAPEELWPSLLTDILALLDTEDLVYNASDTAKLLANLNTIDLSKLNANDAESQKDLMEKKLELLRLSLCRNLAKAIITP